MKDGWVGQIIMSGEIVYETEPQVFDGDMEDDEDYHNSSGKALWVVNRRILDAFRRLIVG